jgi:hypothetical protein
MILGIGLVSLAALFPIGLARLRDASRYSRSAYLTQSGSTDMSARGLLFKKSFIIADSFNAGFYPFWYTTPFYGPVPGAYDPFTQDTQFYGGLTVDFTPLQQTPPAPPVYYGATSSFLWIDANGNQHTLNTGTGLPIAYDPLWRHQTRIYLDPLNSAGLNIPEARFGAGYDGNGNPTFVAFDSDGAPPSAWGLQRLTNFNRATATNALGQTVPLFPADNFVPSIFVSPEDVVLQDPSATSYAIDGAIANPLAPPNTPGYPVVRPSPVLPDLSTSSMRGSQNNDWRYSWMFTGQQTNVPINVPPVANQPALGATFEGSLVIFENRPFGISQVSSPLGPVTWQVDGETVVEAVWGYSTAVVPQGGPGYGSGADRTVLLRWPSNMPDPVVKVGDWIADVTYERNEQIVLSRFLSFSPQVPPYVGLANPINNAEWDNMPAQRCFWYQVQRVTPPAAATGPFAFPNDPTNYRYMVAYVNSSLLARTVLNGNGQPKFRNAALICPSVVNVIPQTFTTIAVQ